MTREELYLIEILHQTTTISLAGFFFKCCILSKFYIKPQRKVVLSLSTIGCILSKFYIKPQRVTPDYLNYQVVSYRNSTSNHNVWLSKATHKRLYLIEILHQTTTPPLLTLLLSRCILSKFYIKPQPALVGTFGTTSCILSKFYIKPQLRLERELTRCSCILSKFYIKPQPVVYSYGSIPCCILSKFYIKPQRRQPL